MIVKMAKQMEDSKKPHYHSKNISKFKTSDKVPVKSKRKTRRMKSVFKEENH